MPRPNTLVKAFHSHNLGRTALGDFLLDLDHDGDWGGIKDPVPYPDKPGERLPVEVFQRLFLEIALGQQPHPMDWSIRSAPGVLLNWLLSSGGCYPERAGDILFYVRPAVSPLGVAGILRGDRGFNGPVLMDTAGSLMTHALFVEIQNILCGGCQCELPPEETERLKRLQCHLYAALDMFGSEPSEVVREGYYREDVDPEGDLRKWTPEGYELVSWERRGVSSLRVEARYRRK